MSKKKRLRREIQEMFQDINERFPDLHDEAFDFFEDATPFEISYRLSELGVKTAHREGIFAFLDSHLQEARENNRKVGQLDRLLSSAWEDEVYDKGKELDLEDTIFLNVGASHFSLIWSEARLAESDQKISSAEAKLDELKKPSSNTHLS